MSGVIHIVVGGDQRRDLARQLARITLGLFGRRQGAIALEIGKVWPVCAPYQAELFIQSQLDERLAGGRCKHVCDICQWSSPCRFETSPV